MVRIALRGAFKRLDRSMTENVVAAVESPMPGTTDCTICDSPMRRLWSSHGYFYFACPRCQFVRVAPVPPLEDLKDYYDKDYEVDLEGYRRNLQRYGHRDLKFLEELNGTGKMLEVGCSWGLFLEGARTRGWQVRGIELSDSAGRWARENLNLDVTCGTLEDCLLPDESPFDVVAAWHVIEHVRDPINFLRIARGCLRPGGLLALRTPNIRSVPARFSGWGWQWVGAPAHLSLFSPKSLRLAVERAGFSVRHVATRRGDAYNPVFEVLRASALRAGIHDSIKSALKLGHRNGTAAAPSRDSLASRRSHMLRRLSTIFDVALFELFPIEKLFDVVECGAELFLVAERRD